MTLPKGFSQVTNMITISSSITEDAANTFKSTAQQLPLDSLNNEVFIIYSADLDVAAPNLITDTRTRSRLSVSTTARTTPGGIDQANVVAVSDVVIQDVGGTAVAVTEYKSDNSPPTQLPYLAILATSDFYVNIEGDNNADPIGGNVRLYGVRARVTDAAVYASLVQSELLS